MPIDNSSTARQPSFQVDEVYIRQKVHDICGGQRQGGISTPASTPVIFLFTGAIGEEHGYGYDGWQDSETFLYTGEGQPEHGDMRFVRGNKAIRDHKDNNKRVYLFEVLPKRGGVRYRAELELDSFEIREIDSLGFARQVIVFRFKKKS